MFRFTEKKDKSGGDERKEQVPLAHMELKGDQQ